METGQCPCKPGVIGRQCNRCDNPFAEVTLKGCEGTSCPASAAAPPGGRGRGRWGCSGGHAAASWGVWEPGGVAPAVATGAAAA